MDGCFWYGIYVWVGISFLIRYDTIRYDHGTNFESSRFQGKVREGKMVRSLAMTDRSDLGIFSDARIFSSVSARIEAMNE